jgi:MFS transporter, PAT family, beta-lactamase induction signal transducer AmpG
LPFALNGSTLQAWFASEKINIVTIGFLTLVGQPYVFKFLWAPFLDRYLPPLLGRRRGWIALMQVGLIITIGSMAFGNPVSHGFQLAMLALVAAFLSATQDIAFDAYRTDLLATHERGVGAAFTNIGYRIAVILSGGVALIIADHYGWKATYLLMAAFMVVCLSVTFLSPESESPALPKTITEAIVQPWREFTARQSAFLILLFIVLYKIGDAFTVSLSSAFLIQYLHFSLSVVGSINKIVGLIASIFGSVLGGVLLARFNLLRIMWWFGLGQACCSFLYMALAIVGKNIALLTTTVFCDYFLSGLTTTALIVFITGLCDKRFSATQFALFTAVSAIGRVFIGPIAGYTVNFIGWSHFFFISFFVSLPGLLLLWHLRTSYDPPFTMHLRRSY